MKQKLLLNRITVLLVITILMPLSVFAMNLNYSSITIRVGEYVTLTADFNGYTLWEVGNKDVLWIDNPDFVNFSSHQIGGLKEGETTVTCYQYNNRNNKAVCKVTVKGYVPGYRIYANTIEGISMYFQMIDEEAKTCRVGYTMRYSNGDSPQRAIALSTTGTVTIPQYAEGFKVVEIGESAFSSCDGITSIVIPEGITSIGSKAFSWCKGLKSVTLPKSMTSIGSSAFNNSSIATISGVNNLEYIGASAFGSTPLYENMPNGLLYIGKVLYKYKGTIPENTTIDVREGTIMISDEAFINTYHDFDLTIPKTTTKIGAIGGQIKSVSVDSQNPIYNSNDNCNAIIETATNTLITGSSKTTIPESVKIIARRAFWEKQIEDLRIPDKVDSIGERAFDESKIKKVSIGKGLRKIGRNIFADSYNLEEISISKDNPYLDSRNDCNAIIETSTNKLLVGCMKTTIPESVKIIGEFAFSSSYKDVKSIRLSDNVEEIEMRAFSYMYDLETIVIGRGIKKIGDYFCNYDIKNICLLSDFPCEVSDYTFDSHDYENMTVFVPKGSLGSYMFADGWSNFKHIKEGFPVLEITLDNTEVELSVGETQQLTATITPDDATDKSVTWSSSDETIATVSSTGLVTAKSSGKVTITCTANDGSGAKGTCEVQIEGYVLSIDENNFPDNNFREYLLGTASGEDGKLAESEISSFTYIDISDKGIKDLKGIEYFTSLGTLFCEKNQLTSLDVSKLTALTSLWCYNNQLTSLDVSKLTALTSLYCGNNQLTSLDVSKLTALTSLSCWNNQLKELDVSNLTALTSLDCDNNQLTELDVSQLTALTNLSCYKNQLTSLDVSKLTALTSLSCSDNQLAKLDVSNLTALTNLSCYKNQLTSLDVSKLTALTSLSCSDNQLTELDVSKLTALTYLSCYNNQLTSLDVSKLTALTTLFCGNNLLTELDVSKLTTLTSLSCYNNQLTSLDVSKLTALTNLSCYKNQLTSLDVSKLTALTNLSCYNNQLTSLDVSKLTALTSLYCSDNQLTELGVSQLTALESLSCYKNQLTSLDVSKLTALTSLHCGDNQLAKLDVSQLTALKSLSCYNNQLTSLDVSKNTALTDLSCGNNQLKELDVSKNTALTDLYCHNNQLTGLVVSNLKALTYLCCYKNGIKGTAMDNLVSSLPENETSDVYRFRVVDEDLDNESNECTDVQAAAAKAKGWTPCYYNSSTEEYVEYPGSGSTPDPFPIGDVNEDGTVNGTDLVALTNIILGKNPEKKSADVNRDGKVNGTDYVALANIILGKASARQMTIDTEEAIGTTSVLSVEPFSINAGETKEIAIKLTNPDNELTLLQFDLSLPDGLIINKVHENYEIGMGSRTNWQSHQLAAYANGNTIRCLLASNNNAPIEDTEGTVVRLTVTASNDFAEGTMTLHNILGVTPTEQEVRMSASRYGLTADGTTGINSTGKSSKESVVYSVSGQRQTVMKKGVNIVDGKKVIKK